MSSDTAALALPAWETLHIEAGGPGAGLLTPGRVLRALALGAGVSADEVGVMLPLRRGAIAVEIALGRAVDLPTPRLLPFVESGPRGPQSNLFVLTRPDDPPELAEGEVLVSWGDGGGAPRPGALARALAEATELAVAGDSVGAGLAGPSWLRLRVPPAALVAGVLPDSLTVDGRALTLTVIALSGAA